MKTKELLESLVKGDHILVGVYHGGRIDTMNMRDKSTGKPRQAFVSRETILTDSEAVVVVAWMPDDYDATKAAAWKSSFAKGERVVLHVGNAESIQGFKRYSGRLEKLTD